MSLSAVRYDKIIIGAGLYGLYSAELCGRNGQSVLVLEQDEAPFMRATHINQARIHLGYHYPRSISTALKSRKYFDRFVDDYGFCVKKDFKKIYATSLRFSWTTAQQFRKFCAATDIPCIEVDPSNYFRQGMCDGVFETREYTYDSAALRDHLLRRISELQSVTLAFSTRIRSVLERDGLWNLELADGSVFETEFLLNTSYGSINQVLALLGLEPMHIKYELCEIILCRASQPLDGLGITVMDGPFFSIMPFGMTGFHSLTSVAHTPHVTSYASLPTFRCQSEVANEQCSPQRLGNCNSCPARPGTAWNYMSTLARKYLGDHMRFEYHSSLFSIKPILISSEIDDSRPTIIRQYGSNPRFVSTLSGKINTVYDLDEVLL